MQVDVEVGGRVKALDQSSGTAVAFVGRRRAHIAGGVAGIAFCQSDPVSAEARFGNLAHGAGRATLMSVRCQMIDRALKSLTTAFVLLVLSSAAIWPADARSSTVLYHDAASSDFAIGIDDLEIRHGRYNVRFVVGTFSEVIGDPGRPDFQPPPFWGDEIAVIDAANAIAAALNNEDPVAFLDPGFMPAVFLVPFAHSGTGGGTVMNFVNACGGRGTWTGFCADGVAVLNGYASLAVLSVPEPSAVLLVVVAMLAMWAAAPSTKWRGRSRPE